MLQDNARKLTPIQHRAVEWLATPKSCRNPATLEKLAEDLGVNSSTVRRWRTKFGLDEMASEIARGRLFEHLPDVLASLAEKAVSGSYAHQKLFLEVADGQEQKISVTVEDRRSEVAEKLKALVGDEED